MLSSSRAMAKPRTPGSRPGPTSRLPLRNWSRRSDPTCFKPCRNKPACRARRFCPGSPRICPRPSTSTRPKAASRARRTFRKTSRVSSRALFPPESQIQEPVVSIIWTIIIGFVAGIIAKFLHPGPNEPSGFILTTILGIVGALVATYLGQAIGWYQAGEGAGLIGAVVGAVIVLVVWGLVAGRNRAAV